MLQTAIRALMRRDKVAPAQRPRPTRWAHFWILGKTRNWQRSALDGAG